MAQTRVMNVLLVGSGGREHALAWKIAQSEHTGRLICAPGNPGIAKVAELRPTAANDVAGLVTLAREIAADLVVIGPETSIDAGLADRLVADGIACFGPTAAAGRLESSKAFAKRFAARHGLPTGRFGVFDTAGAAKAFLREFNPPYVVKADGLAAGKGVVIASNLAAADGAVDEILGGRFASAGNRLVIEEFLEGEIASIFALCDGSASVMFGSAQDHKRAFDGDRGPNTGGMGAYAPAPALTPSTLEAVRLSLVEPAFAGIAAEGSPFQGALFCEAMLTTDGPKLVEFNARFGDPECQVLMLQLRSDIVPYLAAAASENLTTLAAPVWREGSVICVVLAAKGYPGAPELGAVISGAEADFGADVVVFHAGTARRADGALIAAGGRVLNVCARGPNLAAARDRAYEVIDRIDFPGGFCRRDIGWRALPQ